MRWFFLFLCFLFLFFVGCSTTYQEDAGFLSSGVGESPEMPVLIDRYECRDISGKFGLCSLRLRRGDDLLLQIPTRPYPYRLHLLCSKKTKFEKSFDVDAKEPFSFVLESSFFSDLDAFICVGEIFPKDRREKVSAKFEVRVKIFLLDYVGRESMRLTPTGEGDYFLFLGKNARYAQVFDENKWSFYEKQSKIKVKNKDTVRAVSESHAMRFNQFP